MDKQTEILQIEVPKNLKQALDEACVQCLLPFNDFVLWALKDAVKYAPRPKTVRLLKAQASLSARRRLALENGDPLTNDLLEPWERVLKAIVDSINAGRYNRPYQLERLRVGDSGHACLLIQTGNMMQFLAYTPAQRPVYDELPVKSVHALNKALSASPLFVKKDLERVINGRRIGHMMALSIEKMEYLATFDKAVLDSA